MLQRSVTLIRRLLCTPAERVDELSWLRGRSHGHERCPSSGNRNRPSVHPFYTAGPGSEASLAQSSHPAGTDHQFRGQSAVGPKANWKA